MTREFDPAGPDEDKRPTIDILGHTVRSDLEPGDLVLDLIILARVRSASQDRSGIVVMPSEDADETVITGLLHRAANLDAAAEADGMRVDD